MPFKSRRKMRNEMMLHVHRHWAPRTVFALVLLLLATTFGFSQTALTGGLRGIVTDPSGASIPGAVIRIENKSLSASREVTADANGQFTILNLTPSITYSITVSSAGFRTVTRDSIAVVSAETNIFDISLEIAARSESVEVTAELYELQVDSSEISQVVDPEALTEIPLFSRNINRAALLTPKVRNTGPIGADSSGSSRLSINGRIYRETHYKLDGSANFDAYTNNSPLQTVSQSAIQEYKILSNQYSAEHGGTTAGFLIATTKSGTRDFHGEAFFLGRPSGLQANPPLATMHVPNQLLQYGASVSGPIYRDRTLFFANYEGTRQDRGSFITLPKPGFHIGSLHENMGLVRVDHNFTDKHSIGLRFNAHNQTNDNVNDRITYNAQAAQQSLPSTAALSTTRSLSVQFNDNYTINANFINEFRFSFTDAIPGRSEPVAPGIVIIRPGISTEGNGSYSDYKLKNTQVVNQMTISVGNHSIKFGGDYTNQKATDVSYQAFGTYTLDSNDIPTRFQQSVASDDLRYGQTRVAAFIQDDWRVMPHVTLNLGLRYDYQSLIDDYNNFGPRIGVAYNVGGKGSTVIRGGAGMYYDQPFFHGFSQRYLLNGPTAARGTITLTGADAAALYPNSLDPRSSVPQGSQRSLFLKGENLHSPYSWQFTMGVQQKIFGDWILDADYAHIFSRGTLMADNINAPLPFLRTEAGQMRTVAEANATRPYTMYLDVPVLDVLVSRNMGKTEYNGLNLGLSRRFARRYNFVINYVFSESKDAVTDDHLGANPNEWNNVVDAEFSPSDFNQRHRFVGYGTIALPRDVNVTLVATLATGIKVNPITGVDNNGDGRTVDRPVGFSRNSFEGPSQRRFDISLAKNFMIDALKESSRFEIRMDVFNLFNNSVFYRFNNTYGNGTTPIETFLTPVGGVSNVDPGRQFQFTGRFAF